MKVICINGDNLIEMDNKVCLDNYQIVEGDIYTVIEEVTYKGIEFYSLEETPFDCLYAKRRFAPLSEIDETTFERNYQTQTA